MADFTFQELVLASGGTLVNVQKNGSVCGVSTDTREELAGHLFLAIRGESFDGHAFAEKAVEKGAVLVCVEKEALSRLPSGLPMLVVENTLRAYQDIAAFHRSRFPELRVAALTGSCGKTSTKEMLRAIFEEAYGKDRVLATEGNTNNQVGVPKNLLKLTSAHKAAVIEMGTNHFGEILPLARTAQPQTAMIVSIARCHLEALGSLEGVAAEKSDIFTVLPANGTAVIPADAAGVSIMEIKAGKRNKVYFGNGSGSRVSAVYHKGTLAGSTFALTDRHTGETAEIEWSLSGAHQAANAAGAAAAALAEGIPFRTVSEGLRKCTLPGLRMKKTEHDNALWINDAYNANGDSMAAGLRSLAEFADGKKLLLVLGDMLESGRDEAQIHQDTLALARKLFPDSCIAAVGNRMTKAAEVLALPGKIYVFPDSETCAEHVESMIPEGGIVYLKASHGIHLEKVESFHEIG